MKKYRNVSAKAVATGLIGWLVLTNILVWAARVFNAWPSKAPLLICISFLPGFAILRLLKIVPKIFSIGVLYCFGLSLLTLILSGLMANQILFLFGDSRPLDFIGAFVTWDVVTALLIGLSVYFNRQFLRINKWFIKSYSKTVWLFLVLSLLLPALAIMGAYRLNNGGDALFAEFTLVYAALMIIYVFLYRHRLPNDILAWFIFIIGLSVLLMTSMRGWDITGHDIEREFRVYNLTRLQGRWNIGLDRDPYNACLSITILPQMFAKLLNISGLVVFKVVLQIIFAVCPVVVFTLLRRYVSKLGALVGAMLFICYPTFITDSAMLTRQGVAYLFFALALLVISNKAQKTRYKILFTLCSLGAVLSHYSTAYMFVALFAMAAVFKMCIVWWHSRHKWKLHARIQPTVLSLFFAGILFAMTFIWYAQITATTGGLISTLHKSFVNIPKAFSSENKSTDTSSALVFASKRTTVELYQSYLTTTLDNRDSVSKNKLKYIPLLVTDDLPITRLGKTAQAVGYKPSLINSLRQNFAKILQVLAIIGVLYATVRLIRRKNDMLDYDYICLNLAGLVLLVLMVLLPVLSINYGVLRAFQQILIFLILPIMLLIIRLGQRLWNWLKTALATTVIVLLFLLFTGLFGQILGGVSPPISLNNKGLYYSLYYSSLNDSLSFKWLKENIPRKGDVRASNFKRAVMSDPKYPFTKEGILPSQIGPKSFVYLDSAQVKSKINYTYFDSSPLIMNFPLEYYETFLNQIYSTTNTRIYR